MSVGLQGVSDPTQYAFRKLTGLKKLQLSYIEAEHQQFNIKFPCFIEDLKCLESLTMMHAGMKLAVAQFTSLMPCLRPNAQAAH